MLRSVRDGGEILLHADTSTPNLPLGRYEIVSDEEVASIEVEDPR